MTLIRLNLGCGSSPLPGFINLDNREIPGVDIVRDVLRGLPFSDSSVGFIQSDNFLEHLPQTEVIWVMNEMWRVLINGGEMVHSFPEAGTVNYWQDPTHLSHWHRETLTYFQKDHRRNKYYGGEIKPWVIEDVDGPNVNGVLTVKFRKVQP
jgi:predicted SAM-dependent methyltransferase